MDMNKAFMLRKEDEKTAWRVVDASGQVLGRLATDIADMLRGKDKAIFTPHADAGDYVIVINSDKIVLTGDKWNGKVYRRYTGYRGGQRERTAKEAHKHDHEFIVTHAVKGMLPKNRLSRALLRKLRVYAGAEHPHEAQVNTSRAQ